ncbi:Small, acid-soluble spore protein Tlp [Clostridium liquoris]|uniref:Protein Tlp homolog n=1 Tax=Clostridium liquoris TaxID=1289519 RepID=A0A2T0B736_9CLOT|nr:small acid-soluble spore protein Tlp [Clostridium liquoris]PRR79700.1 Small, acid-soluble spore protein Tlp [Clostridium liquoris]
MKSKPDDRRDNVDKIQYNIDKTIQNYNRAEEMISVTDDEKTKNSLTEKNERRLDSLSSMREEIKDEAMDKQRGYK